MKLFLKYWGRITLCMYIGIIMLGFLSRGEEGMFLAMGAGLITAPVMGAVAALLLMGIKTMFKSN